MTKSLFPIRPSGFLGSPEAIKEEHKTAVEGYNRDDCVSTFQLRTGWTSDRDW